MSTFLRLGLAIALVLFFIACASGPDVQSERIETPDGVVFVDTLKIEATVTAIDARSREIRLKPRYGKETTFTAPPEVRNFDQIQVGDTVRAVVVEETAVEWMGGSSGEMAASVQGVVLAPEGAKPGGVAVDAFEVFGTIVAIDAHDHTVTVEMPDGEVRILQVAKHRDLSQLSLGDAIRFRMAEAIAISVQRTSP